MAALAGPPGALLLPPPTHTHSSDSHPTALLPVGPTGFRGRHYISLSHGGALTDGE